APEAPTLVGWAKALDEAREAATFPHVPAGWFESDPRRVASGFIELDRLTKQFQEARSVLPELSAAAGRAGDRGPLGSSTLPEDGELARRLVRPQSTVLAHQDALGEAIEAVRALADRAASVQECSDRVTSLLHVPPRPLALKGVAKVLEQ